MRFKIPDNAIDALITVTGVVLVWRGIWLILDTIDIFLFNGMHALTGVVGIVAGMYILYRHHKNFDELRKL
jgi:uncharacterized membrane protein (DUF373 family)